MNREEYNKKVNYPMLATPFDKAKRSWHILYNFEYRRPIAVSTMYATINNLAHYHINSYSWYSMNALRNSFGKLRWTPEFNVRTSWEWKYNLTTEQFEHHPDGHDLDEWFYMVLTREKSAALDIINNRINFMRKPFIKDITGQDLVYQIKKSEAEQVLSLPDDQIQADKFMFLSEYAKYANCDLKFAAREVLLQHDFYFSRLADTETLRIKYSRAINTATEISELRAIIADFNQDTTAYARV
jgi:hypothetical protein